MNKKELLMVLESNNERLKGFKLKPGVLRIDLSEKNFCRENLEGIDLSYCDLRNCNFRHARLKHINLRGSNLQGCDFTGADLRGATLIDSDMRNTELEYIGYPLYCGARNMIVDDKLPQAFAAFFCSFKCDSEDFKQARDLLLPYAQKSYRAVDLCVIDKDKFNGSWAEYSIEKEGTAREGCGGQQKITKEWLDFKEEAYGDIGDPLCSKCTYPLGLDDYIDGSFPYHQEFNECLKCKESK